MQRLIDNKLMYGNLLEVDSPTLRERYNRALEILTERRSALASFHIDQTGFSPEIAEELDDPLYLNPHGCNRQFILLSLDQAPLPVVDATFSSTRSILGRFIEDNRETLFALTTRDAVYGELENSTYRIETLEDIVSIKRIRVEVNTTHNLISKAARLAEMIAAFEQSDTAWFDERQLGEMVRLAEATGDIRRHPVAPSHVDYQQGNFYTSHLGGLYVFLDTSRPTIILCDPRRVAEARGEAKDEDGRRRTINLSDDRALARFLEQEDLVQHLPATHGTDALEVLKQRCEFMVVDHVAGTRPAVELDHLGRQDMKRLVHRHLDDLPDAFHRLSSVVRALEQRRKLPRVTPGDPAFFYLLRSAEHRDRDLVNQLIAEKTPLDVRQLFICHTALFYESYRGWPENKQAYVTGFLTRHRLDDRESAMEKLYGATDDAAAGKRRGRKSRVPETEGRDSYLENTARDRDRPLPPDADFFSNEQD
jgi:hypothetical protein